jgi:hypothetical protein
MRDREEADRLRRGMDFLRSLIPFRDAQHQLQQQQAILDTLNAHLKPVIADEKLQESLVRIVSRAAATPE